MQWSKLFRRCNHKYVITYRSDRLVILTCTECGTTKSIRLGDKKAWLKKLDDEIARLDNNDKTLSERILDVWDWLAHKIEDIRDRNSPSHVMSKIGRDLAKDIRKNMKLRGDKK